MSWLELTFMVVGFVLASYAIVGNDAIQTLGTFLASNSKRPWWVLWLFASGVLVAVLVFGWATSPTLTVPLKAEVTVSAEDPPGRVSPSGWTDLAPFEREPWATLGRATLTGATPAPVTLTAEDPLDFLTGARAELVRADGETVVLAQATEIPEGATELVLAPTDVALLPAVRSGAVDVRLVLSGRPPTAPVTLTARAGLEAQVPLWARLGDVSYGRLEKYPLPDPFTWIYVVPPLVLLVLTRFGLPVSTTFLVLTIFQAKNLPQMLVKSLAGYAVALLVGLLLYVVITKIVEKRFIDSNDEAPPVGWVLLQWTSTAFLWAMWLIQDLANIFVYLPRQLSFGWLAFACLTMLAMQAYIFYTAGGEIQKIVTSKTNIQDIRSATIIDFLFGLILLVFKEWSNMPMSTTWVFLGLLAGREIALNIHLNLRSWRDLGGVVGMDAAKATAGLVVSVIIALTLPAVAGWITAGVTGESAALPGPSPDAVHGAVLTDPAGDARP